MWKELLEYFTKQFIKSVGRKPQTPAEMMSIQDDVVRYLNKTKGVPEGPKKPPFQGFTPEVIQGGKSKEGIKTIPVDEQFTTKRIHKIDDELDNLSTKEGKYGNMNRNDRDDLMIKLQDESSTLQEKTLLKDSPEAIARIKADNKAAMERLRKKKMEDRALEDFTDDFTDDPSGLASGGMAREGMAGGGLLRKFLLNKKTVRKAVDDIFPTGDYKYDAEMAAEALVENNPKFFKNKLYDDLSDADRMEVYGSVLSEVQNDLAKMLETRRLSKPTKTLEGLKKEGTIDISNPEVADEFTRFMKESDPKGYKDLEQKVDLSNLDIKGKKGHAEGGRVPMIFGGSAGLKGLFASIKAGLNKGRTDKLKTLFPKYSVEDRELLKLGEKYLPKDSTTLAAKEIEAKAEGIGVLINRLKHDKKLLEEQAKNKAKKDPSLDFLMESLEKTMPEAYGPHLKKYTNIDKDILQLENIKKNLIMKDRKLNAEGGLQTLKRQGYASGTKKKKKEEAIINPNYVPSTLEEMINAIDIKPRASGSFTEGPYGPKNEQRTWSDVIGGEATVDLPWGFELKGDYDKFRIKDRLYSSDDEYLDERVGADHDRWKLELLWKKKFGKGAKKLNQGGRAGSGLNYLLGEDDQNVRMPSGGLPGLLGE